MKLTKKYMDQLLAKNVIPSSAWHFEIIGGTQCVTIRNPIYCNVFWMDFWYNFAEVFKTQQMMPTLEKADLTRAVFITSELELISAQSSVESINYFYNLVKQIDLKPVGPYAIKYNSFFILQIYLIIITIIIVASLFLSAIFSNVNINYV